MQSAYLAWVTCCCRTALFLYADHIHVLNKQRGMQHTGDAMQSDIEMKPFKTSKHNQKSWPRPEPCMTHLHLNKETIKSTLFTTYFTMINISKDNEEVN